MKQRGQARDERSRTPRLAVTLLGIAACAAIGWFLGVRMPTGPERALQARPAARDATRAAHDPAARVRATRDRDQAASEIPPPGAIPGEAVLRFASDEALRRFLADPPKGLRILASEPRLRAVRVGLDDPAALASLRDTGDAAAEFNFIVSVPEIPDPDKVEAMGPAAPFGSTALEWLGAADRPSNWGSDIKVAVLDSGVRPHPALTGVSIQSIDLMGGSKDGDYSGHGTAVASLLAGSAEGILGVAPGVQVLDIRILDASGRGDTFTLAQGILRAADMGAQVITLSLGTYGDSPLVRDAVDYALARNIAIVAAAGNDGYANLSYPARYPGVIAVGAVDATGLVAPFSNTGQSLAITAPGTALTAAWPNGQAIAFSGTSAAVPLVSGAIAYVLADERYLTPSAAASIVLQNADESGQPGADPAYGQGHLNLGRLRDRRTAGLHDLAIASHWVDGASAGAAGALPVQVTVQNRGTVFESYAILEITDGRSTQKFTVLNLKPGAIATRTYSLGQGTSVAGDSVFISSRVAGPGAQDARPSNNRKTSVLVPAPNDQ